MSGAGFAPSAQGIDVMENELHLPFVVLEPMTEQVAARFATAAEAAAAAVEHRKRTGQPWCWVFDPEGAYDPSEDDS